MGVVRPEINTRRERLVSPGFCGQQQKSRFMFIVHFIFIFYLNLYQNTNFPFLAQKVPSLIFFHFHQTKTMKTLTLSNVDLFPQLAFTLRKLDVDVAGK